RRHGRGAAPLPRAAGGRRTDAPRRQCAVDRDHPRPGRADQAAVRLPGRDRLPAAPLRRRRDPDPERAKGARAARLRGEGRPRRGPGANDRLVQGTPAGDDVIRLAWPDTGREEAEAVAEVLETGYLTQGPKVGELERLVASACGVEHALAVSSGTAALHLAVLALGLRPGDEVIVPAYTFPATANVVALAGLKPVLVDLDPGTLNIDPARVEPVRRTKAILAVHLFGRPARLEQLPSVTVIEDAAAALGACR